MHKYTSFITHSYPDCRSVKLFLPDIMKNLIHWSPVVKLLLKLNTLSSHLYAHKNMNKFLSEVFYQGMVLENLFSIIPEINR